MKRFLYALFILVFNFAPAFAQTDVQEFAADMVSHTPDGKITNAKAHVTAYFIRIDMPDGNWMLIDLNRQISSVVMPSRKIYLEQPTDMKHVYSAQVKFPNETKRTSLGKAKMEGIEIEKFAVERRFSPTDSDLVLQWVQNGKIPVKFAPGDESWNIEYRNIILGKQPESLFRIPWDYKHIDTLGREIVNIQSDPSVLKK